MAQSAQTYISPSLSFSSVQTSAASYSITQKLALELMFIVRYVHAMIILIVKEL